MNKRIVFRNMDHSDPIEAHAHQQLEKIVTFLENEPDPVTIDVYLEPSKVHSHHRVELRIKSPNYSRTSSYEGSEFYKVLDRVIDVMYHLLREDKEKRHDKLKQVGRHDEFKKQR